VPAEVNALVVPAAARAALYTDGSNPRELQQDDFAVRKATPTQESSTGQTAPELGVLRSSAAAN
jgi:hypothetical protein